MILTVFQASNTLPKVIDDGDNNSKGAFFVAKPGEWIPNSGNSGRSLSWRYCRKVAILKHNLEFV